MRTTRAIAAFLAALCAACTSSSGGTPSRTMTPPHTTVAPTSTPPTSPTKTAPTTAPTTRPTVPADVPRTGPNTRKGEKPPVMPLAATKHTAAGAQAFAEFFIKTIDWGYATTSSAYMRHYFKPECTDCVGFAHSIDAVRAKHDHYVGGRILVKSTELKAKPFSQSAEQTVGVLFDLEAYEEATHTGKPVHANPAQAGLTLDVSTAWNHGAWSVVDLAAQR